MDTQLKLIGRDHPTEPPPIKAHRWCAACGEGEPSCARQDRHLACPRTRVGAAHDLARAWPGAAHNGALFQEADHALRDAQIRALVANVAVLLAVGVISGGVAAVAGDFAAGLVGGGRAVTTIGEATGALRTARVVGGITNVVVDAGANAAA